MAHFHLDYSPNLKALVDMGALCEAIRACAAEIEALPTPGIRVRAICVDHVAMADGKDIHGFVDMSIRLRGGRSREVKEDIVTRTFTCLKEQLAGVMETHSVALSAEIRDIDPELSPKFGTVRAHMEPSS
ncbi:MAG: 5-carboxymethyl-2-hydroxymuconate isomerase [Pseudomonadota bacterium]